MIAEASVQSIIDAALEQYPELQDPWYAECERQLRSFATTLPVPAYARERTWSKISSALAEGASSAQPQPGDGDITGSAGASLLSGVTAHTPCPDGPHPLIGALEGAR